MSDDESRNENLPTEGDAIFTENGSETVEHGQTGLPPWAAAVTAQLQKVFTAQLEDHLAAQAQAHRAELQELIEECRASARTARMATAQWQDQQEMHEARQERTSHETSEVSPQTAEQAQAARRGATGHALDFADGSETPDVRGQQQPLAPPGPPPKGATNRTAVRDQAIRRTDETASATPATAHATTSSNEDLVTSLAAVEEARFPPYHPAPV